MGRIVRAGLGRSGGGSRIIEKFLEHHGIKGQKWGIRRDFDKLFGNNSRSETLKAKYGPGSLSGSSSKNHKTLEEAAIAIVGGAAIVGGGVLLEKEIGAKRLENIAKTALDEKKATEDLIKLADVDSKKLSPGLANNWEKDIELPSGSILQRVSSAKESTIDRHGFFAAYKPEDITNYKSIIPAYWPRWGIQSKSGYMTHLENGVIKAPSAKKSIENFAKLLDNDDLLEMIPSQAAKGITKLTGEERQKALTGLARSMFQQWTVNWATMKQHSDPIVQQYFDLTKSQGYNALIDFNDAGVWAKTPLRVIDASAFKIVKNAPLSESDIAAATKELSGLPNPGEFVGDAPTMLNEENLARMGHSVLFRGGEMEKVVDFLEHHGIKGQKWGIRNTRLRSGTAKSRSRTQYQKPASKLSDDAITKRIKRMELEKRYSDLNKPDKTAGKKYLHDLLQNSGKTVAGSVVGTLTAIAVKKAITAKFG